MPAKVEDTMIIRDYRQDDFSQVEALWKQTGIYSEGRGDTPEVISECNGRGGKFLILEDPSTGQIAGTSWLTFDGRRFFLHHFAVAPYLQGKGWGRRLARESLRVARERGCPVKLEVHRDNVPAVNLYLSMGFERFEDFEIYMNRNSSEPHSSAPQQ
ncbi:MAG: GNAT family N-acetyltransferase [Bacteroidetes bacterium]|nr:MAG: GNAT family N-acetyltransferase [Bacteroidota bacterium]